MMKLFNKNKRIINADLIRVVAMLMVIFLHTILNFTIRPDFFATKLWFLFEPIAALSKSSVLLFLILSGYLVISKERTIEENSQKILKKIVIPLAFFEFLNVVYIWTNYTRNYLSIPVIMIAVGLFNFLLNLNLSQFRTKILTQIAQLSFGIYLIHPYVISFFTDIIKFDFNCLEINVYLYNFLNVILVLGISSLITIIIKKIPKLRAIIGE